MAGPRKCVRLDGQEVLGAVGPRYRARSPWPTVRVLEGAPPRGGRRAVFLRSGRHPRAESCRFERHSSARVTRPACKKTARRPPRGALLPTAGRLATATERGTAVRPAAENFLAIQAYALSWTGHPRLTRRPHDAAAARLSAGTRRELAERGVTGWTLAYPNQAAQAKLPLPRRLRRGGDDVRHPPTCPTASRSTDCCRSMPGSRPPAGHRPCFCDGARGASSTGWFSFALFVGGVAVLLAPSLAPASSAPSASTRPAPREWPSPALREPLARDPDSRADGRSLGLIVVRCTSQGRLVWGSAWESAASWAFAALA